MHTFVLKRSMLHVSDGRTIRRPNVSMLNTVLLDLYTHNTIM
jgi:hypothetical protein